MNPQRSKRRDGALGIHSMDHFALAVPDLAEAKRFYDAFGLDVREEGGGLALYTFGNPHRWATLIKGPRKHLRYLSFGAYEEDMPRFRKRLEELGIKLIDAQNGGSNGIWFRTPEGVPVEIRVSEKSMPDEKTIFELKGTPGGVVGTYGRSKAPKVHPTRLSHMAIFTKDVSASVKFFHDTVGVRLSDQSPGIVAFMHGIHGSDHHLIAFVGSDGPGFHHCSWNVASLQEVGLGAMQMADAGYTKGWGLGRHVLGSNYFNYIRDPWGSYSEYSSDIDYIPADQEWKAGDHDPADSLFLWGPNPPEEFIKNTENA